MTNEQRKQIDALIAAGEKAPGGTWSPVFSLKTGWVMGRTYKHSAHPMGDDEDMSATTYACDLANARPALKALIARLELAEAVCESCRWEKSGWSGSDEMMYDEKALAAWRAAKEADDA